MLTPSDGVENDDGLPASPYYGEIAGCAAIFDAATTVVV